MRSTASLGPRVRAAALFALGALSVHELRYLLATDDVSARVAHVHGYLELLVPTIVATALAATLVSLLAPLAVRRLPMPLDPNQVTERAAGYAVGLLAAYVLQELAEGVLVGGQLGLVGLLGAGGWLVLPLAMAAGAIAAVAGRWLDRVELALSVSLRPRPTRAPRDIGRPVTVLRRALASLTLAFGLARRPPPATAAG